MKNVKYVSKDAKGNEYTILELEGHIDISNNNIIFLKDVRAFIKLKNSNNININSDFGKYNINNFDTIFSKNVIITYKEKKITSEYLDFSMERNNIIISKNVIYRDNKNILKSDVMELDIKNKDTKIHKYEKNKQVNMKSIN